MQLQKLIRLLPHQINQTNFKWSLLFKKELGILADPELVYTSFVVSVRKWKQSCSRKGYSLCIKVQCKYLPSISLLYNIFWSNTTIS